MDMPYIVLVWMPVFVALTLGLVAILDGGQTNKMLAVCLPLLAGGAEILVSADLSGPSGDELSSILLIQGGALGIVSGILMLIMLGISFYESHKKSVYRRRTSGARQNSPAI